MSRARLTFPVEDLISCVENGRWEKCEDILPVLRHFAMKSDIAGLEAKVESAQLVTAFLLGVQERRRILKARVVETAKALTRSKAWEQALQDSPLLRTVPTSSGISTGPPVPAPAMCSHTYMSSAAAALDDGRDSSIAPHAPAVSTPTYISPSPETINVKHLTCDSPASLGEAPGLRAQPPAPLSSMGPPEKEQTRNFLNQFLPWADGLSQDTSCTSRLPWADELPPHERRILGAPSKASPPRGTPLYVSNSTCRPNPCDDARSEIPSSVAAVTVSPLSLDEQFHVAVQAVLETSIHTFAEAEHQYCCAFVQLRKAAVHAAQLPLNNMYDLLDGCSEHAVAVSTFLLDFAALSPLMRSNQVREVLHILLNCPSWRKEAQASPMLLEKISQCDAAPKVQACFRQALQAKSETGGKHFVQQAKMLMQRWILGCGQKNGQGAHSPSHRSHTALAIIAAAA